MTKYKYTTIIKSLLLNDDEMNSLGYAGWKLVSVNYVCYRDESGAKIKYWVYVFMSSYELN